MVSKILILSIVFSIVATVSNAQSGQSEFKILFYNLENLFDVKDDSLTNDENFTPEGEMHWTYKRLDRKLGNISKVIVAAGGWQAVDLMLFCEVENRFVLEKLIGETPLKNTRYRIIHKESPDNRGIDVAAVYNSERFYPLNYRYYPVFFDGKVLNTREIMCVSGIIDGRDTIHVLGNHWPSRYSGLLETKALREAAAWQLKSVVEDLQKRYKNPKIVIAGDFNENPDSEIFSSLLNFMHSGHNVVDSLFYNLSADWNQPGNGTLKYQSQWFVFDQIIVSGALLKQGSQLFVKPENAAIVDFPFLFEEDKKFGGKKLFRTYNGFDYQGGFSDHLPVLLRISGN